MNICFSHTFKCVSRSLNRKYSNRALDNNKQHASKTKKTKISLLSHLKKVFFVAVNKTLSIFQPNGSLMTDILVCKDDANGS